MQGSISLFKYQSCVYNFQRNYGVNHRGIKMRCNKKMFLSLNIINVKSSPYINKGILRHYNYQSDTKLGPFIVAIRIIPCSCHDFTTILSLSWYSKIKRRI